MIRYSSFKNYQDRHPVMHCAKEWSDFVANMAELREPRLANNFVKTKETPSISPALYGPRATRGNDNVIGWGAWVALDIDNQGLLRATAEEAARELEERGLNYLIYATTKSAPEAHRFRVVIPTSLELEPAEIRLVWDAIVQSLWSLGPDTACKDLSRIYGAPSDWLPCGWNNGEWGNDTPHDCFLYKIDGKPLDVAEVLGSYQPEEEALKPPSGALRVPEEPLARHEGKRRGRPKSLKRGTTLRDSPVIPKGAVTIYLNLPKGEHYLGLYTFMVSVAGRAKALNIEISANDLVHFAKQLDDLSDIKTAKDRWGKKIFDEANRALHFVESSNNSNY